MSKTKKLKEKVGEFKLKKQLKKIEPNTTLHNFESARRVGILFYLDDQCNFSTLKDFLSYLTERDIKVYALGYFNGKEIPEEFLMRRGFNFFCKKDLKWNLTPKNELVSDFIAQPYDILIDLNTHDFFIFKYIVGLSKASFKVGRASDYIPSYDLTINTNNNSSSEYFIEQLKHYLNILKSG